MGSAPDDRDDTVLMVVVTEALSEGSLAAAGSLITRPEILTRALLAGGTAEQQAHWLPRLAAGEPLCAIAITEPDYGSDAAALGLKATRVPGGWRLDGAKTWCTFAGKAGVLMVVARTHPDRALGHKGLSVMLVEKPSVDTHEFCYQQPQGGVLTGRAIPTIGYRGMHSFDLSFEGVFVPDANVVGGEGGIGKGFYYTMSGMVGGRMQTAARACGVMRAALRAAIRYSAERQVFGAPLASFPLTQAKLARMAARLGGLPATGLHRGPHRRYRPGPHGGQPRQAAGLPLGRARHARGVAAARRHGLCGRGGGQPLLRRRTRAVDLRRCRGDAGAEGGGAQA